MDYSTLNDETLIRLVARANADALAVLYDRYSRLVFSVALNVVGDRPSAEEITLDVFTRVWEKAATYRAEQARVPTWLTSITRYRAIDVLRGRGSRPERHSVSWAEMPPDGVSNGSNLEEIAERAWQQARVRAAVAQLPDDQQEALALAYFKGYTHRQIAEALGQPLGTIKTRIRLAMQKLRQMLHEEQVTAP